MGACLIPKYFVKGKGIPRLNLGATMSKLRERNGRSSEAFVFSALDGNELSGSFCIRFIPHKIYRRMYGN
jgi:hypothetical protein